MNAGNEGPDSRLFGSGSTAVGWCVSGLKFGVIAAAAAYLLAYLLMAHFRVRYPFELEWLEGGMLHQVQRILEGQKVYVAPSLEFIPVIYTPLFLYLGAAFCSVTELAFPPVRMVSFLASLGCFGWIFLHVREETRSRWAGFAAAGLYAATFELSGAWFDTARVDSLLMFFVLGSVYLARWRPSVKAQLLAGSALALAYLTKQSALTVIVPIAIGGVIVHGRRSLPLVLSAVALIGGSSLLLDRLHDGWYRYYIFEQPALHGFDRRMWVGFWREDIAAHLAVAGALAVFAIVSQFALANRKSFWFHLVVGAGMFGMAWSSRLHVGGWLNVLMPVHAWIAILVGIALRPRGRIIEGLAPRSLKAAEASLCALCLVQFALLVYDPAEQIPTQRDLAAGRRLLELVERTEGDVFMPSHGFLPALVGKKAYANTAALLGIFSDRKNPVSAGLREELREAIREQRFGLVVSDHPDFFRIDIEKYYRRRPSVFTAEDEGAFWPVTGMPTRPAFFYVPKKG